MTKATDPRNTTDQTEDDWKYGDRFHDTKHLSNRALGHEIHQELIRAQYLDLDQGCTFVVIVEDWSVCVEVHDLDPFNLLPDLGDAAMQMAINKAAVQNVVARFDWERPHPGRPIRRSDRRFRVAVHLIGYDDDSPLCELCKDWHPTHKDLRDDRTSTEHKE